MDYLRRISGIRKIERVRNEEVRNRCGVRKSVETRIGESVLRLYGHIERMDDERVVKRIYSSEFECLRRVGRPGRAWCECGDDCIRKRGQYVAGAEDGA